jgi:hypothetical protein
MHCYCFPDDIDCATNILLAWLISATSQIGSNAQTWRTELRMRDAMEGVQAMQERRFNNKLVWLRTIHWKRTYIHKCIKWPEPQKVIKRKKIFFHVYVSMIQNKSTYLNVAMGKRENPTVVKCSKVRPTNFRWSCRANYTVESNKCIEQTTYTVNSNKNHFDQGVEQIIQSIRTKTISIKVSSKL